MTRECEADVCVVLATYNSSRFLSEQLASLMAQTHRVPVIARDDGSSDDTEGILRAWATKYPGWIQLLSDDLGRLGPAGNFARLLQACDSDLVLLCDSDDRWHPQKVGRMIASACLHPTDVPLLIHSDAHLTDATGKVVADSLWRFHRSEAVHDRTSDLLLRNTVTGCTAMVNRAALDLALPIPDTALMHDWWLALVVAATGTIQRLNEPLVDYRQHVGNAAGARRLTPGRVAGMFARGAPEGPRAHLRATYQQAANLADMLRGVCSREAQEVIQGWAEMPELSPWRRRERFLRGPYRVPGAWRTLGVLATL